MNRQLMIILTVLCLMLGVSRPILAEDGGTGDTGGTASGGTGDTGDTGGTGDTTTTTEPDPHGDNVQVNGGAGVAGDGTVINASTTRTCTGGKVISTCQNDYNTKRSVKLFGGVIDIAIDLYNPIDPDAGDGDSMDPKEAKIIKKYAPMLKALQQELKGIRR